MKEAEITLINTTETPQRLTGKIVKLSEQGYGFITSRDKPFTRIFFHWSGLKEGTKNFLDLQKGDTVTFELFLHENKEKGTKGWRAIRIEVI